MSSDLRTAMARVAEDVEPSPWTKGSPTHDGERVAGSTGGHPFTLWTARVTDERAVRPLEHAPGEARVLAALSEGGTPVLRQTADRTILVLLGDPRRSDPLVTFEEPEPLAAYTFATDLVDRPTSDFPEPGWPTDWGAVWPFAVALGATVPLGLVLWVWYRRRLG